MAPILIKIALMLLALLAAYFTFRRWQKHKRLWFIISAISAVLAALALWLSMEIGIIFLVGAALLFALGELFKKK